MNKVGFRRTRAIVATLVLSTAMVVSLSSQAGAGSPSLNVDPTTVQAGGQITVSQYCGADTDSVDVGVSTGWSGSFGDPTLPPIVEESAMITGGQWSTKLTIPASTAPGSYTVWAYCGEGRYGAVELTVAPAPTTTAAPSTTGATTTTVAPKPAAAPATAVAGKPSYTG